MSVTITTYPKATVSVSPSSISKWSAVHQPIIFEMIRKDKNIISITNDGGRPKVLWVGGMAGMTVGDTVYINSGIYVGNFTIYSITSTSIITLVGTYVSDGAGGYVNFLTLRPNYYVETIIYGINNSDTYYSIGESINRPAGDGTLKVDVSVFLKSLVDYRDRFAYDVVNRRDNTQGGRYNITYQEFWTGSSTSASSLLDSNIYYFVNSAKQIQQQYGSNMGEYVPFANATTPKAKFLGAFVKPTYFPGFPFSISFIYSESLQLLELRKYEQEKDVNGVASAAVSTDLDNGQVYGVNRLMLEGDYPTTTKEVDIWLETGDAECIQYVHNDYEEDEYVEELCSTPVISSPVVTGGA